MPVRRLPLVVLLLAVPIASLLTARASRAADAAPRSPVGIRDPAQDPPGRALYLTNCKACHGVLGAPTKLSVKKYEKIPDLTAPLFWAGRSADSVVAVLRKGVGRDMKSFADKLSADEMRAVAQYARSLVRTP
ncbi:MAG: cytochrome c [Gemmatimonadaceae bacterium]|nr:cytochrome c [Gemmatimonadaceae bacterium]